METEPSKPRNRMKRRERAHQLNQEKQNLADEGYSVDELEGSPPRTSKEKCRAKPRRQRNNSSHSFEEDVIDGFAIMSFKTLEELENAVRNNNFKTLRSVKGDSHCTSLSGDRDKAKEGRNKKKVKKQTTPSPLPSPRSHALLSGGEEDRASSDEHQHNGSLPARSSSRDRLSDTSTHSSSGQGYVCDIESGDEKASESGSDLFTAVSNCTNRLVNHVRPVVAVTPPSTTATLCNGSVPTVTVNPTTSNSSPALVSNISGSTTTTTTTTTTCTASIPIPNTTITTTTSSSSTSLLPSTLPPTTFPSSALPASAPKNVPTAAAIPIRRPTATSSSPPPKQIQTTVPINNHPNKPRPPSVSATPPVNHDISKGTVSVSRTHQHRDEHHRQSSREREREREREKDREREKERERDREREAASSASSLHPVASYPGALNFAKTSLWGSGPSSLYSPAQQAHLTSSSLHGLHSPVFTPHHPLHSHPHHHSHHHPGIPHASHGMFAPPIPPGPSALSASSLPSSTATALGADLLRDFLHQDLNNRLLAHRGAESSGIPPSSFLRAVSAADNPHHHQHLHNHQHMHQHTYNGLGQPSLVPTPPPHLFDKVPKSPFDSGLYRPSLLQGYTPAFASLLPGPSGALNSSLQGAFQPKTILPGQMLLPFREREKSAANPASATLPQAKKQGKWCAVHVRIAWEIYHHQQKQQQDGGSGPGPTPKLLDKPVSDPVRGDPLRHPSHLLNPNSALPRAHDPLQSANAASLLSAAHSRVFDGLPPHSSSFLNQGPLGLTSFPRPAPCPPSMLGLGFGGLGGLLGAGRELPSQGITSPHEWNRLHRTPPSFPVWPKPDLEREKEKEREAERERERERDLERDREKERDRREEERDRELRMSNHRIDDRGRYKEIELSQPSSRPRSRSPVRNGRLDLSKVDHDRRHDDKVGSSSGVKVKEERREEELLQAEREKLIQNSYLGLTGHSIPSHSVPPPLSLSLLDRSRMIPPHPYMAALDPRSTAPSSTVWNPFDKASEFNHRMEMERERDRERMVMFSRLTNAPMTPITLMEQERFKEHMLREQHEREYRQYIERERLSYEQKLRAMDSLAAAATFNPFTQTLSPMFNHLPPSNKGGSPAGLVPGIPPPLIPSMSATLGHPSATSSRSHNNSPSSSKSKGYSLADSTSDMKDKRDSCSTDPDAHSR